MSKPWQIFSVTEDLKAKLAARLKQKEEIFPLSSDPLLASLITCLGLQFEMGRPEMDRLLHSARKYLATLLGGFASGLLRRLLGALFRCLLAALTGTLLCCHAHLSIIDGSSSPDPPVDRRDDGLRASST